MRLDIEVKRGTGLVPYPDFVAGSNHEPVRPRGDMGIIGGPLRTAFYPVFVIALQLISEFHFFRCQIAERCIMELELLLAGQQPDTLLERSRLSVH